MSRQSLALYLKQNRLCCPGCHGAPSLDGERLTCGGCAAEYVVVDGIPVLLPPEPEWPAAKRPIQEFWGALYDAAYARHAEEHDRDAFLALLPELERLFVHREHLAAREMPLGGIAGRAVLEIGSGAGAYSAFFAARGAEMTSVDVTPERVLATARKLDWVPTPNQFALQADAEWLPFHDGSFDIVYSNGVLHHTFDTERAINEVHRVLRPGGRAVVMLYAKHSFHYWVNLFLLHAVRGGHVFRGRHWLGPATEWMARSAQPVFNPETKVYSARGVRRLFAPFRSVKIRKNSFSAERALNPLTLVPRVGPALAARVVRRLERRQGFSRAGTLIYGMPHRYETPLELALGRWMGYGLNIEAVK